MDYNCQLYSTAFPEKQTKIDSIHREGIRIYTDSFRTGLSITSKNSPGMKMDMGKVREALQTLSSLKDEF